MIEYLIKSGKFSLVFFFCAIFGTLTAQNAEQRIGNDPPAEIIINSKHSLVAELGGRTFIFGSLSYEYRLCNKLFLGAGLGVQGVSIGDITRLNDGNPETGNYVDVGTSQMIYANYFVGKMKHKLLITGGLTHLFFTSKNRYPSETELFKESFLSPNLGLGYQFTGTKSFFRFTAYVMKLPESDFFSSFWPWAGISYGYNLGKN